MQPKVILLDWDGTIVDVFHHAHQAMNETLAAFGKEPWDERTAGVQIGRADGEKFPEIFGERWRDALRYYYDANARISAHWEKPDLMPGANELIQFLQKQRKAGVYVGIVSNKPVEVILKQIDQLGWNGHFDAVSGYTADAKNKPDPSALDRVLAYHPNKQRLLPSQMLYIGDMNTDCEFARNTGMRFIGIGDKITLPLAEQERVPDLHTVLARLQRGKRNTANNQRS